MATTKTQIPCPIWSFIDSGFSLTGNKILNYLFDSENDSRQIQYDEEKSTMAKNTESQAQVPCPIGSIIETVVTLIVKGITNFFLELANVLRQVVCEIFVIKTLDFTLILIYEVTNDDNCDNNYIKTNSNNVYTNNDNNSRNNTNNDYDDNFDNNNIENNYDNYDTNNDTLYRTESKINNNTQPASSAISKESECVENIAENIPSVSETLDTAINNFNQPSTDRIVAVSSSTDIYHTVLPTSQFKSFVSKVNNQEDIDDALCLPFSYQYMFDKRTSPWEMKDWDQDELNDFVIEPEKIDRLYHMAADDEDQNFRSWEICCRMNYKGEKYFVEMYANCDYTGFDCQGGGHISITKLPDFFLENMVTMDQNPEQIYKSLKEDGYNVQKPDLLHKVHPTFWNNTPMLKYLCHNAIYKHRDVLPHFKDELPNILANSVDKFIKVKDWDNE